MSAKRVITTALPVEIALQLDQLSVQLDRPKSWIIREAAKDFLRGHQELLRSENSFTEMD